jgi:hypothetical protein
MVLPHLDLDNHDANACAVLASVPSWSATGSSGVALRISTNASSKACVEIAYYTVYDTLARILPARYLPRSRLVRNLRVGISEVPSPVTA